MKFNEHYLAVGVTHGPDPDSNGVVIHIGNLGKFTMDEHMARKMADDILRNANYLWPDKTQEMLWQMQRDALEAMNQAREAMVKP